MSYTGVIVESPAKCGKIEKFLGPGYKAIASFGHFRELDGLGSIDMENNFRPTFRNMSSKSQQISKLRGFIANADEILLAADDDREGEAIAWHVCDTFGLPVERTKRIVFHEITEKALKDAVKTPGLVNMDLVKAQQARQILDLLVGYKVSPMLWDKISHKTKTSLSAGRCQSPALRLVYDNQKEIDNAPGKKVYNTTGYFTSMNLQFALNFNHETEDAVSTFLEDSASHDHKFSCGKPRNSTRSAPTPFTTSGLQQAASNELRLAPKATMEACQKLYEGGYITYMRTDSTTYSAVFLGEAKKFITSEYGADYVSGDIDKMSERKAEGNKNKKKGKKEEAGGAQEAHEAIRPTVITKRQTGEEMSAREARVYALIWRNTVESCMAAAKYLGITAEITAPDSLIYKHCADQVVFPGWKKVAGYDEESPVYTFLQTIKKGSVLDYHKIVSKVTMKELKSHYTEAKLVQLLESNGIGRPSTFSSLVDKIQSRGYVKKQDVKGKKLSCTDFELSGDELSSTTTARDFGGERGKLVIQPLGVLVMDFLIQHFNGLFNYEYTKAMEDQLDLIAKGQAIWHELCRSCVQTVDELARALGFTERVQIPIDAHHVYMVGKYGPVIKCTTGRKTTFKPVREDLDVSKLRAGSYELDDIVAKKEPKGGDSIGRHLGHEVLVRSGRFGRYLECDGRKFNVPKTHEGDITIEDAVRMMTNIRHLGSKVQVREGQYGPYVMIKADAGKKPRFLHLKGFTLNPYLCEPSDLKEWVDATHKMELVLN